MRSSTLQKETADDGQSSRTVPTQSSSSGIQDADAEQTEIETLRQEKQQAEADIERLESEIDRLHRQLTAHEQSRQAVVDRYEGVIIELESAAATAPQESAVRTDGSGCAAGTSKQTTPSSVFDRLRAWLF